MPHRLIHAKAYPFAAPKTSYVLTPGGVEPLQDRHWDWLKDLTPVIASGSNRSPDRLSAKYQDTDHAPIPVTRAQVHGIDSVYSAHVSTYGSIPATLHPAPGVVADLAVNWLDDANLQRMHDTESLGVNYDFVELKDIHIELDGGDTLQSAYAYISRRGAFAPDGAPIALAAVAAQGRTFEEMHQDEVMARAHAHLHGLAQADIDIHETIDDLFLSLIERAERRFHISDLLERAAIAYAKGHKSAS